MQIDIDFEEGIKENLKKKDLKGKSILTRPRKKTYWKKGENEALEKKLWRDIN